jgi:hypothetical protein
MELEGYEVAGKGKGKDMGWKSYTHIVEDSLRKSWN